MFEVGESLTLENNQEFAIAHIGEYKNEKYMLLLEMPGYKSYKFVKIKDENTLELITDYETIEALGIEFDKK